MTEQSVTRRGLSRADKRRLGILPWQITLTLFAMRNEGADLKNMTVEQLKAAILLECQSEHPEAWADGVDWEAIAEFLERIIPLILQIISLFL